MSIEALPDFKEKHHQVAKREQMKRSTGEVQHCSAV